MEAKKELLWWKESLSLCNGRSLISPSPQIIIRSDTYTITRLGSDLSRSDNRGAKQVKYGGTKVSHKCSGAQDSQIRCNVLHIKGKGCNISTYPHGHHNSPVIFNENEGTKNQELTAISK